MNLLAYLEMKEARDLDDQMATFLICASVVILLSWVLISLKKWLTVLAAVLSLLSAYVILHEVWWTWSWLDPNINEKLEPTYIAVAFASALFPLIAIASLRIAKKRRPNLDASAKSGITSGFQSQSASTSGRPLTIGGTNMAPMSKVSELAQMLNSFIEGEEGSRGTIFVKRIEGEFVRLGLSEEEAFSDFQHALAMYRGHDEDIHRLKEEASSVLRRLATK